MKINWKRAWIIIKWCLMAVIGVIITIFIRKVVTYIVANLGKVGKSSEWIPDKTNETIIHVKDEKKREYIPVKLPLSIKGKQLKSKDIKAVGRGIESSVIVEVLHKPTDMRNIKPIKNSAYNKIKKVGKNE